MKTRTLPPMAEKALLASVLRLAKLFGWLAYHTHDSRHSAAGFPDLVLVRPPRLIFAELKSKKGVTSLAQDEWIQQLCRVGRATLNVEVYVWRPSDLEEIARILR